METVNDKLLSELGNAMVSYVLALCAPWGPIAFEFNEEDKAKFSDLLLKNSTDV